MENGREAEEILDMLRHAEVVGSWKVLNWLNFEFDDDMTVEDTVEYAMSILRLRGLHLKGDKRLYEWFGHENRYKIPRIAEGKQKTWKR